MASSLAGSSSRCTDVSTPTSVYQISFSSAPIQCSHIWHISHRRQAYIQLSFIVFSMRAWSVVLFVPLTPRSHHDTRIPSCVFCLVSEVTRHIIRRVYFDGMNELKQCTNYSLLRIGWRKNFIFLVYADCRFKHFRPVFDYYMNNAYYRRASCANSYVADLHIITRRYCSRSMF